MELSQDVIKGQQVYTKFTLSIYDFVLYKVLSKHVWGCDTSGILALYNQHISANHLDVGVGSGFLLDNCTFPNAQPRIALMDLNEQCLAHCAKRLKRYQVETYRRNILAPINFEQGHFDSISLNYLLHCLPGKPEDKAIVFDSLYALLNPGGVMFGNTIICDSEQQTWLAKRLMKVYNRKQVFSNTFDTFAAYSDLLTSKYDVSIAVHGSALQFVIKKPLSALTLTI